MEKLDTSEQTWEYFVEFFTIAEDDRSKNTTAAEAKYTANEVKTIVQQEHAAFVFNDENADPNINRTTQGPVPGPIAETANSVTLEKILQALQSNSSNSGNNSNNNRRNRNYNDTGTRKSYKAQSLDDGMPVTYSIHLRSRATFSENKYSAEKHHTTKQRLSYLCCS